MPELPEVETVVRTLNKKIKGLIIKNVKITYPNLLKTDISITDFENTLKDRKIDNISRIAKHIIFELQDLVLISHLRMEGKWFVYESGSLYDTKHVEAIFELNNNKLLVYSDTRKFGTFHLQEKNTFKSLKPINKVGPEPFDSSLNGQYLYDIMSKSNKHIKTILLDQTKISGIGNIYADEILFDSKIHPEKRASSLKISDYDQILKSSIKILKRSVELGGSTIDSYQPEQGIDGKFQNELKVHTRKGKPCYECGKIIEKIKVNGRGTYFCQKCQSLY
ncbi:DNA-formamidopyrimidine glycosylase [Spiroplasma diminutum]|uniref:Formamidopyrimidine-DNA glycosylase n=1 Tax=Spiroplasma diminutum CUAS-1 TaxID=1276221 RepID=S5M0M4_9MOLU|nr:DNA-formamidopyrimidine glycosylase [Spiroplasma diminutum]AGR42411.1 formamidopyrimidine-DNA glycosylase [Spiroplasma diminutum CUAS-1]